MEDRVVGAISGLTHRLVRANGIDLHVVEAGNPDGAPVILLHGFPDFWWGWRHVIRPLAEAGRRVIVPDMRGYGRSDAPQGVASYHLDILVCDVIGLADALDMQRFDLAGHDWGGIVAWSVAARRPDRVAKLVAVAAPHPDTVGRAIRLDPRQLGRSLYVGLFQIPRVPELILSARRFALLRHSLVSSSLPGTFSTSVLARYIQAWGGRGRLRAMLNYYRGLRRHHAPIGRVDVPTVVIWGGKDRFLGEVLGRLALGQCSDARLIVLGEVTHWVPHEDPNAIVVALLSHGGERKSPSESRSRLVGVHPGTLSAVEGEALWRAIMSDGKTPVQADGKGTYSTLGGDPAPGKSGGGESGGGAYPNPHSGKKPKDGFLGPGGQTEIDQKTTPGEPRDSDGSAPDAWPEGRDH